MEKVTERFLKYVTIDTQSDPTASTRPSTAKQFDLLNVLNDELIALGVNVDYDRNNGYIYGKIAGNVEGKAAIGFLAHVDTAPDFNGANVNPQIITNYDGGVIKLNHEHCLDPQLFTDLNNYVGQTIITTDGNSLLGADDKAGVSEIMEMVSYFVANPEIEHGDICIGFTTDEEIGTGANDFDVKRFGADFAYTVDGGVLGELQYENFNAAGVSIEIVGRNVHPGTAKNGMINSQELAIKFHNSLPTGEKPELTEGYEGFIMLHGLTGSVELTTLNYIIRDHDMELFTQKKAYLENLFNVMIKPYSPDSTITITDQYYNMSEKIKPEFHIIELATEAMKNVNVTPLIEPIRGGTDGSKLSFMGLPCPNIFTGGHNFHGRFEYIVEESMVKSVQTIIEIIKINGQK